MANEKFILEVEIRQNSTDFGTDEDISAVADVTEVQNTFPEDMNLSRMSSIRAYIDDDHDEAIDVDLRHTHTGDADFSGEHTKATVSLTSGAAVGDATLDGPVGRVRLVIKASGAAAAPTSGSMLIEVLATG